MFRSLCSRGWSWPVLQRGFKVAEVNTRWCSVITAADWESLPFASPCRVDFFLISEEQQISGWMPARVFLLSELLYHRRRSSSSNPAQIRLRACLSTSIWATNQMFPLRKKNIIFSLDISPLCSSVSLISCFTAALQPNQLYADRVLSVIYDSSNGCSDMLTFSDSRLDVRIKRFRHSSRSSLLPPPLLCIPPSCSVRFSAQTQVREMDVV